MQTIALQEIMPESQVALIMSESLPCDSCKHKNCDSNLVACWDYAHYLDSGKVRNRHREPSSHIYQRMMKS